MALTVTIGKTDVFGNKRCHIVDVAFDTSYPTGGESLTARDCGMAVIDFALFEPSGGYTFEYDHTNSLLIVYVPYSVDAGSETAGANNTICKTGSAGPIEVGGSGTAFQVAGVQVTSGNSLAALTAVRGLIIGS